MTNFKRGDVVLIRFPFSDSAKEKKRPALILSTEEYHRGRREILVAGITSNVDRILPGDTNVKDWKEAGLLFPSLVAAVIQTKRSDMIEKKIGSLSKNDFEKVQFNLKKSLGF